MKVVGPHWYAKTQTFLGLKKKSVGATALKLMPFWEAELNSLKLVTGLKFMEP